MITRRVLVRCALAALTGATAEARQAASQAPVPPVQEVQPAESRLRFYGFVRQDVIVDDSRPDSASRRFIQPEPDDGTLSGTYTMHPRLTRFGLDMLGPELEALGGARVAGKLEIDFQNGGRDSRAIPRYRHAYMTLTWARGSVLLGQTWDLASPLFPAVNADTLMWNAGNLGDRRPQIRGTLLAATGGVRWSLAAAAGLTGAVDQLDLDTDGIRDGEAASLPTVQGRAGVTYPFGARALAAGVWVHTARQETATSVAGDTRFASRAVGADVELPLGPRLVVRGEVWTGANLSDIRRHRPGNQSRDRRGNRQHRGMVRDRRRDHHQVRALRRIHDRYTG